MSNIKSSEKGMRMFFLGLEHIVRLYRIENITLRFDGMNWKVVFLSIILLMIVVGGILIGLFGYDSGYAAAISAFGIIAIVFRLLLRDGLGE